MAYLGDMFNFADRKYIMIRMGNRSTLQKSKDEAKEKEKLSRETLGKYFYDLSKLTFGALVLGGIISLITASLTWGYIILITFGCFASFILAYIGFNILKS